MRPHFFMLLGLWGTSLCLTVLYLGMRAVMDVGGACAEGGAYQIAVHCPQGVALLMPLSIFLGLFCAFLYTMSCPPGAPNIALLFWTALFASLGWNFLDYGFLPLLRGGNGDISWTICGVVFQAMAFGPLLLSGPSDLLQLQGQRSAQYLLVYGLMVALGVTSGYALYLALT